MTELERLAIAYVKHRGTANGPAHFKKLQQHVNKLLAPHRYEQEKPEARVKEAA